MPKKFRRAYPTVQAWMEATGTNQAQLAKLIGISEPHLSNVLSKSRRCSLYVALKITKLTNVPIESLVEWPASYEKVG
jgi:antitoxin component HigA of HigAB toxin-antitoxin module